MKQAADDIAHLHPHAGWKRPNESTLLRLSVALTQKHMSLRDVSSHEQDEHRPFHAIKALVSLFSRGA